MNTCHRVLPFLERTLEMNNGGKNFFMGDQVKICNYLILGTTFSNSGRVGHTLSITIIG